MPGVKIMNTWEKALLIFFYRHDFLLLILKHPHQACTVTGYGRQSFCHFFFYVSCWLFLNFFSFSYHTFSAQGMDEVKELYIFLLTRVDNNETFPSLPTADGKIGRRIRCRVVLYDLKLS